MNISEVNRRNFIKVMAGGSSIVLIPSVLGVADPIEHSPRRSVKNLQRI